MEITFSFRDWLEEAAAPGPTKKVADTLLGSAGKGARSLATRFSDALSGGSSPHEERLDAMGLQPFKPQDPAAWHDDEMDPEWAQAFSDWGEEARFAREKVRGYLKKVDGDYGEKDNWLRKILRFLGGKTIEGLAHTGHWFYETAISPDIFVRVYIATKAWIFAYAAASKARKQIEADQQARGISKGQYHRRLAQVSKTLEQPAAEMAQAWKDFFKFKIYGILQGHLMWYVTAILWLSNRPLHDWHMELFGWKIGVYVLMVLQGLLAVVGAAIPAIGRLSGGVNKLLAAVQPEAFKTGYGDMAAYGADEEGVGSRRPQ